MAACRWQCQCYLLAVSMLLTLIRSTSGSHHILQAGSSVASCFWIESQKACVPSYQNMLAVSGAIPSNVFRKAYLMALDRSAVCSKSHPSEAKCMADTHNRCFWRKLSKAGICLSADYAEVTAFERSGLMIDIATIPSSLTCPGSKAHQFFSCYSHPAPDLCTHLAGCAFAPASLTNGKPVCLPKWAATLDKPGSNALAQQLRALDPTLFGSCEATCWLKQAHSCSTSSNDPSACQKNPECIYNVQGKTCLKAQVAQPGKDAYDDKLAAIMTGCATLTTKAACTSKKVKLDQAGKWASWKAPAARTKCPSPLL